MTGAMTSENMSPGLLRVMERVSQAKGVCKHLGIFMRRISGGAVWSNRPRTDLARAPVEQSAGATLRSDQSMLVRWKGGGDTSGNSVNRPAGESPARLKLSPAGRK